MVDGINAVIYIGRDKKENNPSAGSQRGRAERGAQWRPLRARKPRIGPITHPSDVESKADDRSRDINPWILQWQEGENRAVISSLHFLWRRFKTRSVSIGFFWVAFLWQQVRGKARIIKMEVKDEFSRALRLSGYFECFREEEELSHYQKTHIPQVRLVTHTYRILSTSTIPKHLILFSCSFRN